MSIIQSIATWLEATQVATIVGQSMWLIASLSAVHVLGYALVMGGALVTNLRLMGVLLQKLPVIEVTRPASHGILWGLIISLVTGILLVSFKASSAIANGSFQIKMLLLVVAVVLHFTWQRSLATKLSGAIGLALWLCLAIAAYAYFLFE